jgi:hypothetical protein
LDGNPKKGGAQNPKIPKAVMLKKTKKCEENSLGSFVDFCAFLVVE